MSVARGPLDVMSARGDVEPLAPVLARAVDGDRAALEVLLRHVSPSVLRALRSMLGTTDIDDALQESLLAFVDALPGYRGETNLRRYALRIGIRTALAARRRERARSGLFERHVEATEPLVASPSSPSDDLLNVRRREAFRMLLDELPENQAEALALRVVFEYSLEEIAAVTGALVNTIRSRVRLAREALRARIEADPELQQLLEGAP
ncbi:MAG: RNA polymerase sigma factor [Labilithrix sp.]|nr:RNA polymerase sigma factor [Labilithrix sp.]MBX3222469.1 RNA polymerase sigma factor [Labilithrix sp.]